ncbi:uncharacterized protein LOC135499063 [Lineus longissimus]|uniref:uncharacterized protein LOC135499063 n=1 Tax=Lineus longissimus TaxID=88925 RepID=UPI00315DE33D
MTNAVWIIVSVSLLFKLSTAELAEVTSQNTTTATTSQEKDPYEHNAFNLMKNRLQRINQLLQLNKNMDGPRPPDSSIQLPQKRGVRECIVRCLQRKTLNFLGCKAMCH